MGSTGSGLKIELATKSIGFYIGTKRGKCYVKKIAGMCLVKKPEYLPWIIFNLMSRVRQLTVLASRNED